LAVCSLLVFPFVGTIWTSAPSAGNPQKPVLLRRAPLQELLLKDVERSRLDANAGGRQWRPSSWDANWNRE